MAIFKRSTNASSIAEAQRQEEQQQAESVYRQGIVTMRDLIAPRQSLPIAFGQRDEGASRPKRIPYVPNSPLDAPFGTGRQMHLMELHRDHLSE